MVMVTPALQALLVKFPNASITLLTTSDGKRTFNGFSNRIDNIILYDRKSLLPWLVRRKIKHNLQQEHYDAVYCFESNPNFKALFNGLDTTVYSLQSTSNKSIHYSQHCLNLLEPNSKSKMAFPLHLPVTKKAQMDATAQLTLSGISDSDFVIGLHPSFSGLAKSFGRAKKHSHHKVWPIEFWSKLATLLQQHAKQNNITIKIIMDLVPEEEPIGETIHEQSNGAASYQCPPLNFERYKATLARFDLLITPNSGPMHIAAAVNTKVIALFSRHEPSDCQPFVADELFTVLRAEDRNEPEKGLAAIEPETVLKACIEYLPN